MALSELLCTKNHCIILGDFNQPHVQWSQMRATKKCCEKTVSFMSNNGLSQHILVPTRFNPDNILDLCFSNTPIVEEVNVGELFVDHRVITVLLNININTRYDPKTVLNFRKANYEVINGIIANMDWTSIFSCMSVETMYQTLLSMLQQLIQLYVPLVTIRPNVIKHSPAIRKLQKKKLNIWRAEGNSLAYKEASAILKNLLIMEERESVESKLVEGSSKDFYKFINAKLKPTDQVSILLDGCELITDDKAKAEFFASSFAKVYTVDNGQTSAVDPISSAQMSMFSFEPHSVERELFNLKPRINTTPDGIPAIFLKNVCTAVALPLSIIFNASVLTGVLPKFWKTAIIKPIHKKGLRTDPNNFRPISLTSSICKTLERLIRRNLVNYLNSNNLMNPQQFGFRSRRGTESQLVEYQGNILSLCNKYKSCYSVYVDFRRAFDKVSFSKLIEKLKSYGIHSNLLNWLQSFLSGRSQSVKVENALSIPFEVKSGVPQGSVLGPLLFLLYINDINVNFQSQVLLYADDLKLFSNREDLIAHDLELLRIWCEKWQMDVAPEKCNIIKFSHLKSNSNPIANCAVFNGANIPPVTQIRDLGIIFSGNLVFNAHINTIVGNAQRRINVLFNILKHAPLEIFLKCFIIYARPLLEYGSVIFSPVLKELVRKIEKFRSRSFIDAIKNSEKCTMDISMQFRNADSNP
ncbi:hypothetical protein CRE_20163 [Caenorhabditis remanei]|uniref:Reverse transcriptase domain-containing protein n=1 Tax=Caenorhabditis remanei TaxID=31234 RepID=E3NVN9_CAERE|nr:hypothetical protein CRE_20163 [Caenorhabditis remanei]